MEELTFLRDLAVVMAVSALTTMKSASPKGADFRRPPKRSLRGPLFRP